MPLLAFVSSTTVVRGVCRWRCASMGTVLPKSMIATSENNIFFIFCCFFYFNYNGLTQRKLNKLHSIAKILQINTNTEKPLAIFPHQQQKK